VTARPAGPGATQQDRRQQDPGIAIRPLSAEEVRERSAALAEVLIDCVAGGASVSFMAPLDRRKAEAFWQCVAEGVARGERALLVAEDGAGGEIVGTVQLVLDQPENQPHRADLSKMLVCRHARRRGVGAALMRAAEDAARARDQAGHHLRDAIVAGRTP
jgi:GNAT superfamily N-acetyltransferase